jgi:hypothetical protein
MRLPTARRRQRRIDDIKCTILTALSSSFATLAEELGGPADDPAIDDGPGPTEISRTQL